MNKKKVIHILDSVGGVKVYLKLLAENIDSNQFKNIIVHDEGSQDEEYRDSAGKKIKEYHIPIQREISLWKDLKAVYKTRRILISEQPDIIHSHSSKGGAIARLAALFLGRKVLHTPHGYSFLSAEGRIKKSLFLGMERILKNFNSILLATSESERNRAIQEVGYKPKNALLFNNSIEPIMKTDPLSIEKTWPNEYICSVGRPSFQKNIEMMVEVIKQLKSEKPNIHLVLMGIGLYSPNLVNVKELIKEYNLESNITLLEWTKREDVFHIVKNAKFYISTARYEGLPYSIIEALALKKACVVTDADGNRDLIEHDHNGFVVFEENVEMFKNRVVQLLNNEDLRAEFEERSLKKFNRHFNIENTVSKLEHIYLENSFNRK